MKKVLILCIGIMIASCNQTKKIENFDWLVGKWIRLNEEEGKETFENWKKISPAEYVGIGFTMQDGDTIKQESIRLIKSDQKWKLVVKVPEEAESITFSGTSHTENEFIVENPDKIRAN